MTKTTTTSRQWTKTIQIIWLAQDDLTKVRQHHQEPYCAPIHHQSRRSYKKQNNNCGSIHQGSTKMSLARSGKSAGTDLNETQPAFNAHNVEVAAFKQQKPPKKGSGGNSSSGSGGCENNNGGKNKGKGKNQRPPRHPSNPPESCCDRNYQFADQAYYCVKPLSCPWVNKVVAPQ